MTLPSSSVKVVTHGQYAKIRVVHADPRWRHGLFFANALGLPLRMIIVTYHLQKSVLSYLGSGEKMRNKLGQ